MKRLELNQGSPEWHAYRRCHMMASDAAAICGVHPYKSAKDVWEEKNGKEPFVNDTMRRGAALEIVARFHWIGESDIKVDPVVVESDEYPWMGASLDGLSEDGKTLVEIKTPTYANYLRISAGGDYPIYWYWQIQHQLLVTGLNEAILIIYSENGMIEKTILRNEKIIAVILEKEREFYEKNLISFKSPKSEIPEREDKEIVDFVEAYKMVKKHFDEVEKNLELCKHELVRLSNGSDYQCKGVKVQKINKPGAIDYKAISELSGIDLEKYRKPGTGYWRINGV